jgi:hypothetical protein
MKLAECNVRKVSTHGDKPRQKSQTLFLLSMSAGRRRPGKAFAVKEITVMWTQLRIVCRVVVYLNFDRKLPRQN